MGPLSGRPIFFNIFLRLLLSLVSFRPTNPESLVMDNQGMKL